MGGLKKSRGGIVNNNSIGSLVFCPSDASSEGFVDLRIIINASHQIALVNVFLCSQCGGKISKS